jgi:hypothetical protein
LIDGQLSQLPNAKTGIEPSPTCDESRFAWFRSAVASTIAIAERFLSRKRESSGSGSLGDTVPDYSEIQSKPTAAVARFNGDSGVWGVPRVIYSDSNSFKCNAVGASSFAHIRYSPGQKVSVFYETSHLSDTQVAAVEADGSSLRSKREQ